ncbi:hypothetical protein AB0C10_06705 [Microbispora amethystogenes]|uniref:hypothetical protein n=1 Tax=Microbispora amethystogenes TaxID=1427754 RepID=UPI0033C2775A
MPAHERLWRLVLAVAIVGGPLGYAAGSILIPAVHEDGATSIAANAAANPVSNTVHLVAYVLASYLLPLGAAGLAYLAYARAPWLSTIGGLLAVVGWLPFSALTALDDLTMAMAALPASGSYAGLLDEFANDAVMGGYLLVYVIGPRPCRVCRSPSTPSPARRWWRSGGRCSATRTARTARKT